LIYGNANNNLVIIFITLSCTGGRPQTAWLAELFPVKSRNR